MSSARSLTETAALLVEKDILAGVFREGSYSRLALFRHPGKDVLIYVDNEAMTSGIAHHPEIACVITTIDLANQIPRRCGVLLSKYPAHAFWTLHRLLAPPKGVMIDATIVRRDCTLRTRNGTIIEDGAHIEDGAILLPGGRISGSAVVRAGAVISGAGFQVYQHQGKNIVVPHYGRAVIRPDVEVQSLAHIDRAIFPEDATTLEEGVKIDSLVQIGHNARVGKRSIVAAGSIISGGVQVGEDVRIGPGVVVRNSLRIGDRAIISMGSVVTQDVPPDTRVTGNFAIPHERFLENLRRTR